MEVFVDIISRDGRYHPATTPTWIDAGVGRVVPYACRFARERRVPLGERMAVYHVEEMRYVPWPSFAETSVRDFDTLVVVACDDPDLDDGKPIEAHWLLADGMARRRYHEAEARLRRFEHGAPRSRAKPRRAATM